MELLREGTVLTGMRGKYEVRSLLAKGGMSVVYLCEHLPERMKVALKEMWIPDLDDRFLVKAIGQFSNEGKILAALRHPGLPVVDDFFMEKGRCYLVMEYIEGENLSAHIFKLSGVSSERTVLEWAEELLVVLSYLHGQEPPITCRDLKPANIMITSSGSLKLIDFGIAKQRDEGEDTSTFARHCHTDGYAAFEQYGGGIHTDGRTDLYALGATLYFALTRAKLPAATDRIMKPELLRPLRELNPAVSPDLERLIHRALEIKPDDRYQSAGEMLHDIRVLRDQSSAVESRRRREAAEERKAAVPGFSSLGPNDKGFEEFRNEKDGSILILVPAGEFIMGSGVYDDEKPLHKVYLDSYCIGRCEVTNGQFAGFVKDAGYTAQGNWREYAVSGREKHPVVSVTWNDAVAYCTWAGLRLPAEAEWEKAARGTDGRVYPWGNGWDKSRCTCSENRGAGSPPTRPVGAVPSGASPFGALDMAGNVWEWCSSLYRPYPYRAKDGREDPSGPGARIVRGGSWGLVDSYLFRCAVRNWDSPGSSNSLNGFRVGFSPPNTR